MTRSISGYNMAARKGKDAAMKYCQSWQIEITAANATLTAEYAGKKISLATYNYKREQINRATRDLNDCIQSVNRQFG